jgi:two-component system nitrate/nitrite response regulator NarL
VTVSREATLADLTRREREILGLLAEGTSTRRIAEKLDLSRHTVRTHVQNILLKLGAHSRLEAVATGVRLGIVKWGGRDGS